MIQSRPEVGPSDEPSHARERLDRARPPLQRHYGNRSEARLGIAPQSVIVSPVSGNGIRANETFSVKGWAWAEVEPGLHGRRFRLLYAWGLGHTVVLPMFRRWGPRSDRGARSQRRSLGGACRCRLNTATQRAARRQERAPLLAHWLRVWPVRLPTHEQQKRNKHKDYRQADKEEGSSLDADELHGDTQPDHRQ